MNEDRWMSREELLDHLNYYGSDTLLRLSWLDAELQDDKEIVLGFIKHDGLQLKFASERLRGDKEVVLAAITQNPASLKYASTYLRSSIGPEFLID